MPPEQTHTPSPIQPEAAKPTPFWSRKIVWIPLVIVLVLIIVAVIGANFYRPNLEQSPDKTALNTPVTGWYQSNTENIRFVPPEGWAVDNASNPSLPAGFKDLAIVLRKTGSACTIVEAKRDTTVSDTRKQISFADRVFSSYTQFDGDWWLASTSDSAKYSFSNDTRQYLAGEFRISANLRNDPFLLFMADGTAVPDDCNNDFNALLKTVEPYYETVYLDSSSKGVLTTEKVWADTRSNASNKSYEHLLFMADGSKEKREVMRISTGTWGERFSVSGNKLYVPSSVYQFSETEKRARFDSAIYALDPLTGQTGQIPGTATTDSFISSLYIRNRTAYYLAGNSELGTCLDGYHPCAADLYSIPLAGGKPTLIAHSSLGGFIMGYVESEGAFYIWQGWGDAGCSSTSINKIVGSKEEIVGEFAECVGESEADNVAYKEMQETVNAITTKAGASKISSEGIRIENNILQPASGDVSGDATFYFDK